MPLILDILRIDQIIFALVFDLIRSAILDGCRGSQSVDDGSNRLPVCLVSTVSVMIPGKRNDPAFPVQYGGIIVPRVSFHTFFRDLT